MNSPSRGPGNKRRVRRAPAAAAGGCSKYRKKAPQEKQNRLFD